MSAPTQADLATLDYAFQGQPFVEAGQATGLDLAFQGRPFDTSGSSSSSSTPAQPVIFFVL